MSMRDKKRFRYKYKVLRFKDEYENKTPTDHWSRKLAASLEMKRTMMFNNPANYPVYKANITVYEVIKEIAAKNITHFLIASRNLVCPYLIFDIVDIFVIINHIFEDPSMLPSSLYNTTMYDWSQLQIITKQRLTSPISIINTFRDQHTPDQQVFLTHKNELITPYYFEELATDIIMPVIRYKLFLISKLPLLPELTRLISNMYMFDELK